MLNAVLAPREHLLDEHLHRARRACAAVLGVDADRLPARLVELLPRVLEARAASSTVPSSSVQPSRVADRVERADAPRAPSGSTRSSDDLDLVLAPGLEGRLAEQLAELELLEQQEVQLAKVGLVAVDGGDGLATRRSPWALKLGAE